jgi:hypothetical protein
MATAQKATGMLVEWVRADEEILSMLRPDEPLDPRASFEAFGERQFGPRFSCVACCCELPGEEPRRWEAALELRETVE